MESVHDVALIDDLNHPESRKRALYAAFASKDLRFDGQAFVGVSSTGIYCRTVCTAHMPKYENCTFYKTAAEAEQAGYRPCLICRPEQAPGYASVDATENLARRAAALIRESCTSGDGLVHLAARLGYTDRHLRRAFQRELGVTPVQYLQTCRLLLAKNLLTDSNLPVGQVALASGFKSVRRFNELFKERYRLTPSDLRKRAREGLAASNEATFMLNYRPPYRFDEMLAYFRTHAIAGVETVDTTSYARTVRLHHDSEEARGWVRVSDDARRHALRITISESLLPATSQVIARLRRQFDIDCDPQAVLEALGPVAEALPGLVHAGVRIPGCLDPFEAVVRAILAQQMPADRAAELASRIASCYGTLIETDVDGLDLAFPTSDEICSLDKPEEALCARGIPRMCAQAIVETARLLVSGELRLDAGVIVSEQMRCLQTVDGVSPAAAADIAMRALCYPDAPAELPAETSRTLPDLVLEPARFAALRDQAQPWRSYAAACVWHALARAAQ